MVMIKKLLFYVLFAIPLCMMATSCSRDNDVTEWYDNLLKEKIELFNQFKADCVGGKVQIYCGGILVSVGDVDSAIIENGRYLVFYTIYTNNTYVKRFELANLVGYSNAAPYSIYFQ